MEFNEKSGQAVLTRHRAQPDKCADSHCSHRNSSFCLHLCTFAPAQTTLILTIPHLPEQPIKSPVPSPNVLPQHHTVCVPTPPAASLSVWRVLLRASSFGCLSAPGTENSLWQPGRAHISHWFTGTPSSAILPKDTLTLCTSIDLPYFPVGCCCHSDHVQYRKSSQDLPSIRRIE